MAAQILDEDLVTPLLEGEEINTLDPIGDNLEDDPIEEDLPEKYKGKSAKDIIAMHQEAEKLLGKQGSEVGELRRVVDDFIKAQSTKDLETEEAENDLDYFTDPKQAIEKAIKNHPSVKEAERNSIAMKREATLSRLATSHPKFMDTINDPSFQEWVMASKVRTEIFNKAENQFDYDSADELLSTWKEKQEVTKSVVDTSRTDRDQQLRSADVGSTGTAPTASKKKYRRSDIIKLMQTDPSGYAARVDEIQQAYAEGRVY